MLLHLATDSRTCSVCGEHKTRPLFTKDHRKSTGMASICRACNNRRSSTYVRKTPWSGDIGKRMTAHAASNYSPVPEAGCWLWLGARTRDGYGVLSSHGKNLIMATRLFYHHHRGQIPAGMLVLHKCDTPLCVNPDHLFLGTHQDNMDDMKRKGRHRNWRLIRRESGNAQPTDTLRQEKPE